MNSIQLQNGMDTIFMNFENSKTSDPHRILLNLSEKKLKRSHKYVARSNVAYIIHWKKLKSHTNTINLNIRFNLELITWITWQIVFFIRYSRLSLCL